MGPAEIVYLGEEVAKGHLGVADTLVAHLDQHSVQVLIAHIGGGGGQVGQCLDTPE